MKDLLSLIFAILYCLTLGQTASACPKVDRLIDFNCDERGKIAITGDSIVRGIGDELEIGFPGRLRLKLPNFTVENVGVPGITSQALLQAYQRLLNKPVPGNTELSVRGSDIIIISVGVNDYWSYAEPGLTVRNIMRLVRFLRRTLRTKDGLAPHIIVATIAPTTRAFQQPFVDAVNAELLRYNSAALPIGIRFDTAPFTEDSLTSDGLHPSQVGYDQMVKIALRAIKSPCQKSMLSLRPDLDVDGVYDYFELKKFGTDPTLKDSDGDSLSDGDELFLYRLNPLSEDSNGDGIPDTLQAVIPTATPTPTPQGESVS